MLRKTLTWAFALMIGASSLGLAADKGTENARDLWVGAGVARGVAANSLSSLGFVEAGEPGVSAERWAQQQGALLQSTGREQLSAVRVESDMHGQVHVLLQESIAGIPVVGGEILVHSRAGSGEVYAVNGRFARDENLARRPGIGGWKAIEIAAQSLGSDRYKILDAPSLTYVIDQTNRTHLAWVARVQYRGEQGVEIDKIFAHAYSGAIVERHPEIHRVKNRRTYTSNNGTSLPGTLLISEGGSSSDSAAQAAHTNGGLTYDFYWNSFSRDSFDGSGATITQSVHYQSNYNNAFWNGSQMVYGDGDGTTFSPLSGSLDVVAHELTHAVTERSANLTYQNESGALNEAMSDIMGASVEVYRDGSVNSNTWKLGEDIYTPGTAGDALRYMDNPTADGSSYDYYPERYTGTQDNGGVHLNSGIANLSFVLMTQGGSHPRGKTTTVVSGIGMTKATTIFYRALTVYMTSSTNFEGARNATAQAAQDLYGQAEIDTVHAAWNAVGVPGGPVEVTALTNGQTVSGLAASTGAELHYALDVTSGASNLNFSISGGSGDADLYVKFGAAPTTSSYDCRPYKSGNVESCAFASPSTGTYYVMLRAYSTFSAVSLVGSFDGGGTSNDPPAASFTYSASDLTVSFSDSSSDTDGTISSRSWNFGDGGSSTATNPSHTYGSGGTFTVTLTVTDNDGDTDSTSQSVSVTEPAAGPTELQNGVSQTGLAGATGDQLEFFMGLPSGATDLAFNMSGGSGDADLYVKFGSMPTPSSYDCRPYKSGNTESCSFAAPSAGTWYVMVRAYSTFASVSLVGNYSMAAPNNAPTANFTFSTSDLAASFSDASSDSDGTIASRSWNFGDGSTSTSTNPSHTYSAGGTYTVSLTVTDDDGASNSTSKSVAVTEPAGGGAPCTGCTEYTGSLSSGGSEYQPNGTYYYTSSSGSHKGWLEGPAGSDFDLYLYKWEGGSWKQKAKSTSSSSSESISYYSSSGYFLWKVTSYSGSGSYSFWLDRP